MTADANLSDQISELGHQTSNLATMLEAVLDHPNSEVIRNLARETLADFHLWQQEWHRNHGERVAAA